MLTGSVMLTILSQKKSLYKNVKKCCKKKFYRLTAKTNSKMIQTQKVKLVSDKTEIWNTNRESFSSPNCSPTVKPVVIVTPTKRVKKNDYLPQHKTTATTIKLFSDEVKQIKKCKKVA